ncbi:MAG: dienelactone hydrolase family protein [Parvularcula sp.]
MTDIKTYTHEYRDRDMTCEGFVALPSGPPKKVVLICHAWGGPGKNERLKAELIAGSLGYAAFAIDVYGKGQRGSTVEECEALMTPLMQDRAELQIRLRAGIEASKHLSGIDHTERAAVGYCFGGLCALDMARAGMDVTGVASFHALLGKAENLDGRAIKAKVIAFHGWDDPMATPEDVRSFTEEMTAAKADWQLHAFGGVKHAFTTQGAHNEEMGTIYNADADRRSWAGLRSFLAEILGE